MLNIREFKQRLVKIPLTAALGGLALSATAADLDLKVGPVTKAEGSLMVAIYRSADSFRKEAVQSRQVKATAGTVVVKFSNLEPGNYAVALFQDLNDNGKLDTNLLGIPQEPYGFSRISGTLLGPPGWDDTRFDLPAQGLSLTIPLR